MKKSLALFVLTALSAFTSVAHAADRHGDLGVGVILGDITGPTVKYFTGPNTAIDVGLGFDSDFDAVADYLWHSDKLFPKPPEGIFGGYLGVGPRFEDRDSSGGRHGDAAKDKFGVRAIGGLDYWTANVPLEFFVEFGPWFVFTPDTDTEFDAGIGLRYYFNGSHRR